MKSIDALVEKARAYKEKGLNEKEIGDELHLSPDTVTWLLTRGREGESPVVDVKIGWRSMGVHGCRIGYIADIVVNIVTEEMKSMETDFDTVVGIAINGIPLATLLSEKMGKELAIYRPSPSRERGGAFSSNYASVDGKKTIVIDDVLSSGDTIKSVIEDIKEHNGTPVLAIVLVNKTEHDEIGDVRLRALIRARTVT